METSLRPFLPRRPTDPRHKRLFSHSRVESKIEASESGRGDRADWSAMHNANV